MPQPKFPMTSQGTTDYIHSLPSKYRTPQVLQAIANNRDCFEVPPAEDKSLRSVGRVVRLIQGLATACNKPRPVQGVKLYFANRPGATLSYNAPVTATLPVAIPRARTLDNQTQPIPPSPSLSFDINWPSSPSPPAPVLHPNDFESRTGTPVRIPFAPSSPVSSSSLSCSISLPSDLDSDVFNFEFDDDRTDPVSRDGDLRLSFSSGSVHYDESGDDELGQGWTIR